MCGQATPRRCSKGLRHWTRGLGCLLHFLYLFSEDVNSKVSPGQVFSLLLVDSPQLLHLVSQLAPLYPNTGCITLQVIGQGLPLPGGLPYFRRNRGWGCGRSWGLRSQVV